MTEARPLYATPQGIKNPLAAGCGEAALLSMGWGKVLVPVANTPLPATPRGSMLIGPAETVDDTGEDLCSCD